MKPVTVKVPSKWANYVAMDIHDETGKRPIIAWGRTIQSLMKKVTRLGLDPSNDVIYSWVAKQGKKYIFAAA